MGVITILSDRSLPLCSDRPLPRPYLKALAYHNPSLVRAAALELHIALETSLDLFFELKLFCYMCYSLQQRLPVPVRIDNFWHIFLDFDRKDEFDAFCLECFGGTIEHLPLPDRASGNVNPTVDHAHDMFGSRIADGWQGPTRCDAMFKAAA